MKCPICVDIEMVHDTRDLPFSHKGVTTTLAAVTGDFCDVCGEVVCDLDETARINALKLEFSRQVNSSVVDPGFIASVRKKLALDQREASEIFGGGVNAFAHYENGKNKPPLALVKLLRILDRHPHLLAEIKYDTE